MMSSTLLSAPATGTRTALRLPPPGGSLRLAFVGQATYFDYCALDRPAAGIVPTFVDFRAGADPAPMREQLAALDPHVVFVFRPELIPPGLFAGLRAVTVGYLTEPLPRPGPGGHPDLDRRLEYLKALDPGNFDRIASFDPLVVETVDAVAPVWRSFAIPVADAYFAPVARPEGIPRALFTGRSTAHREHFLAPVKHAFDVIHLVHGVTGKRLREFLGETQIGINLHNEPYLTFENRVLVHLAAGHLVISEPLSPTHGLEPGIDFLEARYPDDLHAWLLHATAYPEAFHRVRVRGRMKAEAFRASRVYPRLVRDLLLDVAAFGSARRT